MSRSKDMRNAMDQLRSHCLGVPPTQPQPMGKEMKPMTMEQMEKQMKQEAMERARGVKEIGRAGSYRLEEKTDAHERMPRGHGYGMFMSMDNEVPIPQTRAIIHPPVGPNSNYREIRRPEADYLHDSMPVLRHGEESIERGE